MRMAGLWESIPAVGDKPAEERFLVLTRDMVLHGVIHDRTPVLLTPAGTEVWLDPKAAEMELLEVTSEMKDEDLMYYKVIRNAAEERADTRKLLEPI